MKISKYDHKIWHKPIPEPSTLFLGKDFASIELDQIPFDHSVLVPGESIKNEDGQKLVFRGSYYTISTNDSTVYLRKWFCKWEKI